MKHVLFLTKYPSPYRVQFFNELGKSVDVTVLYTDPAKQAFHRDERWFSEEGRNFRAVQLPKTVAVRNKMICLSVISWLKKPWDAIIICGYALPTNMVAISWLKSHKIPFYMEVDGGLIREDSPMLYRLKRTLVSAATAWIGSGEVTSQYLAHYGADPKRIYSYPFTSLWQADILPQIPEQDRKQQLRIALGMEEEKIIVFVGRLTREKGMDTLLQAMPSLDDSTGVYFIGGEPSQSHLDYCRRSGISHAHYVGFCCKEELTKYYQAADLFVLPTESDVWGLVINEAMANGLPVITTDRCVAGLELVRDGVNGYIVPVNDPTFLAQKIHAVLDGDYKAMGRQALETIRPYTLENMAKAHIEILEGRE